MGFLQHLPWLHPMPLLINLVATRSTDGDHGSLFRWYHDHVHLLLGFSGLQGASLYQRQGEDQASGPHYLCLYAFASLADFMAFESSPARARAQQVIDSGWARTGIEILQRTQYYRIGRRRGQDPVAVAGTEPVHHVQSLSLGAGSPQEVARWLADRVHVTLGYAGYSDVAWHLSCSATGAGGDALVVARTVGTAGARLLHHGAKWVELPPADTVGQAPASVALHWQGGYRRLCTWDQ